MLVFSISNTIIALTIRIIFTIMSITITIIIAAKVWGATLGAGIQWLGQLGLSQMQVPTSKLKRSKPHIFQMYLSGRLRISNQNQYRNIFLVLS